MSAHSDDQEPRYYPPLDDRRWLKLDAPKGGWPLDPLDEDTEHGVDMRNYTTDYRSGLPRAPRENGYEWNTCGYLAAMWGVGAVFALVLVLGLYAWANGGLHG